MPENNHQPKSRWATFVILAIFSLLLLLAGFFISKQFFSTPNNQLKLTKSKQDPSINNSMPPLSIGSKRPDFKLRDLNDDYHQMSEWDGKIVLVNFWATWCPPCRKEMPAFIDLKKKYADKGFEIVGIAIDEPKVAQQFSISIGVNYPLLYGDADATQVVRDFGNSVGALPYSVLVNRDGKVSFIHSGELKYDTLETEIQKLLEN